VVKCFEMLRITRALHPKSIDFVVIVLAPNEKHILSVLQKIINRFNIGFMINRNIIHLFFASKGPGLQKVMVGTKNACRTTTRAEQFGDAQVRAMLEPGQELRRLPPSLSGSEKSQPQRKRRVSGTT
jgi:hypothetical protein